MESPQRELERLKIELQTRQLDPLNLREHDPAGYDKETSKLEAKIAELKAKTELSSH